MFKYKIDNMNAIASEVQKYTQRAYHENPSQVGSPILFRKLFPTIFDKTSNGNYYKFTTKEQMVILIDPLNVRFYSGGILLHQITKQNENESHPIDEYVNDFFSSVYQELESVRNNYKQIDEQKKNKAMAKFIKKQGVL